MCIESGLRLRVAYFMFMSFEYVCYDVFDSD